MKYTKEKRREIYLKAIELVENEEFIFGCCNAVMQSSSSGLPFKIEDFPELEMFKPCGFDPLDVYWFKGPKRFQERAMCLLLCAYMPEEFIEETAL